jgi:hypothetical protein
MVEHLARKTVLEEKQFELSVRQFESDHKLKMMEMEERKAERAMQREQMELEKIKLQVELEKLRAKNAST